MLSNADFGKPFKEEIKKMEAEATNPRFLDYTGVEEYVKDGT